LYDRPPETPELTQNDPKSQPIDSLDSEPEFEPDYAAPRRFNLQPWLNLFYSILLGVAAGSVIAKLWHRSSELPEVEPVVAEIHFELANVANQDPSLPLLSIRNLSDVPNHNRRLTDLYLSQLGLPAGMGLIAVELANDRNVAQSLTDKAGSLTLELADGQVVTSVPLPPDADSRQGKLRLAQARLDGDLPPSSSRTGWKLLPSPVDLSKVRGGSLELASGDQIKLRQVPR